MSSLTSSESNAAFINSCGTLQDAPVITRVHVRARSGWPVSLHRACAYLTACHILLTQVFSANASLKVLHELLKSSVPQAHDKWTLCQHLPPTPPQSLPPVGLIHPPTLFLMCFPSTWLVRGGCSRAEG